MRLRSFVAALGLLFTAGTASASDMQPAATFRFDIVSGPLEKALAEFERITGTDVAVPSHAAVNGLQSPGATGAFTPDHALERLLAGTGLTFRLVALKSYLLEVQGISENVQVTAGMPYRGNTTMTATRTLTPLRDVPQAVTVITQAMMSDQQMQSVADVVRYVPGVGMAQGEGNRDNPILRGNGTSGDFYVDGIRDDVQYYRDLYNVESVEALKGPNAMIFGRGGAGGVINRATKQADWSPTREFVLQGGSSDHRRATLDLGGPVHGSTAGRITGMYENSDSYRRGVNLERYGFNPTLAFIVGEAATIRLGYERFHDQRNADRGIPSFAGRPVATDVSTFFGDADHSYATTTVDALTSAIDYRLKSGALVRNRTRFTAYDKFYQNVYPSSAVSVDGTSVTIAAYNHWTPRRNLFSQTDLNLAATTGRIRHTLLAGVEVGRQTNDNRRKTGYFGGSATTATVRVADPSIAVPIEFRQSASDADNHGLGTVASVYVQDQAELSPYFQAIAGARYDRFNVDVHNNRTAGDVSSRDNLVSPRLGLVYKPAAAVSVYSSYSLTYLPRAGEQLSSLSITNQALEPERFTNYEVGAKWDIRPEFGVTAALYRLDRTNVAVPDPADPTRSMLIAGQRAKGLELSAAGNVTPSWSLIGAYAFQSGTITRTLSTTAQEGARLGQMPAHTFSLWNKYRVSPRWAAGAGIVRNASMFTSTDNTVVLPAFTRVDAAVFVTLTRQLHAQINVENLFDERYYSSANGNNNIAPGAPRALRVSLTTRF